MKTLVTGGAGFIGVNYIDYVQRHFNADVRVLENFSLGERKNLEEFDVEIVEGDIRDPDTCISAAKGVDSIIHLAAHTRVVESMETPRENMEVNVTGTFNILSAAREQGIGHFVMASTGGAILGDAIPPVHEDMVPHPISPYGASKLAGEGYCSAFSGAYGMQAVALRFSNVYGPRSFHKGSVVAHFFKRLLNGQPLEIYGDGTQTRDFVYVEDLSCAIHQAAQSDTATGCYQLGSGQATSVNDLIDEMRKAVGQDAPIETVYHPFRDGEVRQNYAKIDRAREELGYEPEMTLPEGLRRTWAWMKEYVA